MGGSPEERIAQNMRTKRTFTIVLVSPSDVQAEREEVKSVIGSINNSLRGSKHEVDLQLVHWETDAHPGMHTLGPQGLIDECLRIDECDALIGVFWKRFGTPIDDASTDSGTAHEIRSAIAAWKSKRTPQVMLYFSRVPSAPNSVEEADQLLKVQQFKQQLLATDRPLVWEYESLEKFLTLIHEHLFSMVLNTIDAPGSISRPVSSMRISLSANNIVCRHEGFTELVGELFLHCTNESNVPYLGPQHVDVELYLSAPITSRRIEDHTCEIILCEVGFPGDGVLVFGTVGPLGSYSVTFSNVPVNVAPHQTRVFEITNIRCDGTAVPRSATGRSPVFAYVKMTGLEVESPQQVVAEAMNGSCSAVTVVSPVNIEGEQLTTAMRGTIATLSFVENFAGAFKSRVSGRMRKCTALGKVSTGESSALSALIAVRGDVCVAGLAECGTRFQADFARIPGDVTVFVSVHESGTSRGARLLEFGCASGQSVIIAGTEARELSHHNGRAMAVWEVVTAFHTENQPACLSFVVIAVRARHATVQAPVIEGINLMCSLSPIFCAYASGGPIPQFSSTVNVATVPTVLPIP